MANDSDNRPADVVRTIGYAALSAGLDVRRIGNLGKIARLRREAALFESLGGKIDDYLPMLADYDDSAGAVESEYFHQDLLVAGFIHAANPARHIDVGSRIDGFVAHVATFRPIEVIDIRSLPPLWNPNISFLQMDLMSDAGVTEAVTDSLSCLHAIEHFGLGRYSDPIDPDGHIKGFRNLARMLKPGGVLYISMPVEPQSRVHFNSHRAFHVEDVFGWSERFGSNSLERFDFFDREGQLHRNVSPFQLGSSAFGLGIYTLRCPA
jgi:hypothetical protein